LSEPLIFLLSEPQIIRISLISLILTLSESQIIQHGSLRETDSTDFADYDPEGIEHQ